MPREETILGIEGGGTKTAWALVRGQAIIQRGKLPPSNLRLTTRDDLLKMFRVLPARAERVGVFLAGCGTKEDRALLLDVARTVWRKAQVAVGSDRDAGMAACLRDRDGIVVNAGTGSSVTGRRGDRVERAGGWGHILGDTGGAYFVSIRALRVILRDYDLQRENRRLAASVLSALGLNNFDELVRWAQTAEKTQIASLAPVVFAAAAGGDQAMQRIIVASAQALADFASAVAGRLQLEAPEVVLMGGVFESQDAYVESFATALLEKLPRAQVALATVAPEVGAVWLAGSANMRNKLKAIEELRYESPAATEQPSPISTNLEKLTAQEIVELFVAEEKSVASALRQRINKLAQAIEMAADVLSDNGRIFYVGAGTSGRLGVMDAAEIPPTFGAPPDFFQAIIAGGVNALQHSVEGAEDDEASGAFALEARNVARRDLIIGVSASGRAPFVVGALRHAREIGARTILLTCNPELEPAAHVTLAIVLPTGPEILAGSTRLKAGTATKVALNIISTGAMVHLGRVRGNLMIDLQPTNKKLRARAMRLVAQLSGCDEETARRRLKTVGWNVRAALKE